MFNYRPFKMEDSEEARKYNRALLADGVKGVECATSGVPATAGEKRDYLQFCPFGTHFGSVERYTNDARNFFVRDENEKVIGVFRTRPLDIGFNL